MNPVEQGNHRRVTDAIAHHVESIATATAQRFTEIERQAAGFRDSVVERFAHVDRRINEERTHRLKLADEQRGYVDMRDRDISRAFESLRARGFFGRMNWLLTGR